MASNVCRRESTACRIPNITAALSQRGLLQRPRSRKILGGNLLRVFREVETCRIKFKPNRIRISGQRS